MNEQEYMRSQEDAAFGQFLVETIAEIYGCDAKAESVNRAVYKNTDCGAWVAFDEAGIKVGTIVEGSDAEFSTRVDVTGLDFDEPSATLLVERFRAAIQECEDFSSEVWAEMTAATIETRFALIGTIELMIKLADAESASHQGQCDADVLALSKVPYIAEQLSKLNPETVARELQGYGAWEADELTDHDQNLQRLLWLACGDVVEEEKQGHAG